MNDNEPGKNAAEPKGDTKPPEQKRAADDEIELLKLEFQKKVFWWDWLAKVLSPLFAAVAVTTVGALALRDLKPIHLETGSVTFDESKLDSSCICWNTVAKSRIATDAPLDVDGRACVLSSGAVARVDRPDIGEPYYSMLDFEPHRSVQDRRCYRQSIVHVSKAFSQIPNVSLQIAWIDARTYDETKTGMPVLIYGAKGAPLVPKGLNLRFDLRAEKVTKDGFDIMLRTWADSRIYAAQASYMAFIQ